MKKIILSSLFFSFLILFFISCEKDGEKDLNENALLSEVQTTDDALLYLSDKAVHMIEITGDKVWIFSSKLCFTCDQPAWSSFMPTVEQFTCIQNSTCEYQEPTPVRLIGSDDNENLFFVAENTVYKTNQIGQYELVFDAGEYTIYSIDLDLQENIWLTGYEGIAFWNGNKLNIYNSDNSILPANITHGLAIDQTGTVWVSLDFEGLLSIKGDKWNIIPNNDIPGLTEFSYLSDPLIDSYNNIWFQAFSPGNASNILMYDHLEWYNKIPVEEGRGTLVKDNSHTIWFLQSEYNGTKYQNSIYYYAQSEWIEFYSSIDDYNVLTLNADDNHVYIGTNKGLKIVDK